MVFDDETDIYVPVVYSLVMDKSEWTYWNLLHLILVVSELKFDPATVTTDFERPLMNAVRDQFRDAQQVGCLFHFKQAIRRKLVKLGIQEEVIHETMCGGMMDELVKVKREDLERTISRLMNEHIGKDDADKWDAFFRYFKTTWLNKYAFEAWNISRKLTLPTPDNATNNALENFNRQLNQEFAASQPSPFHFIVTIREISARYVRQIADIRAGVSRHPVRF